MAGRYDNQNFSAGIAQKQWKVLNPDDDAEVVQIGLVDTGLVTGLGEKNFAMMVTAPGGGTIPTLPTTIPPNPVISVTATAAALPTQALVSGAVLKTPSTNIASVWIGGDNTVTIGDGFELEPGEIIPITGTNLNIFWIIGNAADKLQWIGG